MAGFEDRFPPLVPFGSRMLGGRAPEPQRGTDVAVFQVLWNALTELLDLPPGPALPVDGAWAPPVVAAVRSLQRRYGLTEDGIVGPSTYFLLGHGVGAHTTYGGPPFGSRMLRPGDAGGDVYVLQNRLAVYPYALTLEHPADGTFGEPTARALAAFRTDAAAAGNPGLGDGPEVDTCTANALLIYTRAGGRAIFSGRNGLDVAFVQTLLRAVDLHAGPVDGFYGPRSVAAVRAFQRREGLLVDGIVGPATFAALGRGQPGPLRQVSF